MVTLISLFLSATLGFAEPTEADICKSKTFKEFVQCLLREHPETRRVNLLAEKAEGERGDGRRFLNPEIEYESVKGKSLGETQGTDRVSVSYPIELFGQRGARVDLGDARSNLTKNEKTLSQHDIFMKVVLNLYRYRQILNEIEVVEEGLMAYSKVIRMLSERPKLTPDHQVSLSVFKLAEGDFRFKKTNLISDQRTLEDFFSHVDGLNIAKYKDILPTKRQVWPEIKNAFAVENSPYYKTFEFQADKARAENDEARSKTWPTLKASVISEKNISGSNDFNAYGFGVSAEIPLLSFNGGERQSTRAEKLRAELQSEIGRREIFNERNRLIEFYNNSKRELGVSPQKTDVEKKHKNVDALYFRGLISSSLLVEAHRQLLDFSLSQNEIEIKTLEALMKIYAIDGRLSEDVL